MSSSARGGLSVREWEAQNPGKIAPKNSKSSGSSSNINMSQLNSLQKEYQNSMLPTADETATSTGLDNLLASRDLGVAKIKDQPIAGDFVQGQSAGLITQTAAQAQPLEQKLARLQAQRQSAADVLKAKLGFETSNVQNQFAQQQAQQALKLQQQQQAEQQRQFNENLAFQRQQENRIAGQASGASSDIFSAILKLQQGGTSGTQTGGGGFDYNSLFGGGLSF